MNDNHQDSMYKSTFYTSLGTFISLTGQLVSISILTRVLSKEEYGLYIIIIVIVGLFEIIVGLGIDNGLVRFVASDRERTNKLLAASLFLRSISFIFTALLFLLVIYISPIIFSLNVNHYILFILTLSFITIQRDTLLKTVQGLFDFKILAINQILTSIARLATILFFIVMSYLNIIILLIIEIIVSFISTIFFLYHLIIKHNIKLAGFEKYDIKNLLSFSFPLYVNNLLNFLYGRINVIILATKLSAVSAALYDVSGKIPDAFLKLFDSFITVFFPRQSKNYSETDISTVARTLNRSIIIISWLVSISFLILFLVGDHLVLILFSNKYIATVPALYILTLSFYFRVLANLKGYSIVACGRSKVPMFVNIVSTMIGLFVVFILIKHIDFIGAAIGVLSMNLIADALFTMVLKQNNIFSLRTFAASILGYLLTVIVLLTIIMKIYYLPLLIISLITTLYSIFFRKQILYEIKFLLKMVLKSGIFIRAKNIFNLKQD